MTYLSSQGRFCGAEGIENVATASGFRSKFGQHYGLTMAQGPLSGLLARAVVVIEPDGTVGYVQLVPRKSSKNPTTTPSLNI